MEYVFKITDQNPTSKSVIELLKTLSDKDLGIWLVPDDKITLDELIDAVDEPELLEQLEGYRDRGITDLRVIANELGFTDEDKEDLAMVVEMKKAIAEGFADEKEVLRAMGLL